MTLSKSQRVVLPVAYDAACQALPGRRHRFSSQKFTQPHLLACLVLKEFLRLNYRELTEHLADHDEMTRSLALSFPTSPFSRRPPRGYSGRPRPADDVVHVIARTAGANRKYFY